MMRDRHPPGSHYLTPAAAEQAVALAAPMIEAALARPEIVGSGFLHVVVLDPTRPPGRASFEEAVLFERAFGDRSRWDADYAAMARAKARLSWRTGLDGRELHSLAPHLLQSGDSLLRGSVCLHGIVVAASGAFPSFDEAFAGAIACCLRAFALAAREAETARLSLGAD